MTTPTLAQITKIYEVGETDPTPIVADSRFHQITITTQPLNIPVGDENKPLDEILIESNAVAKGSMSGTVQLTASPPRTFEFYEIPEGLIDLGNPTFLTTTIPLQRLRPVLSGISGSTHVAVTISSYS